MSPDPPSPSPDEPADAPAAKPDSNVGPRPRRRRFLRIAAAVGGGLIPGAAALGWRLRSLGRERAALRLAESLRKPPENWPLEERIRSYFHFLKLDAEGVRRFVREHEASLAEGLTEPDDDVFPIFLLSTDFFRNGADENRPVRFVMYYNPYRSPCYNPLAVLS